MLYHIEPARIPPLHHHQPCQTRCSYLSLCMPIKHIMPFFPPHLGFFLLVNRHRTPPSLFVFFFCPCASFDMTILSYTTHLKFLSPPVSLSFLPHLRCARSPPCASIHNPVPFPVVCLFSPKLRSCCPNRIFFPSPLPPFPSALPPI